MLCAFLVAFSSVVVAQAPSHRDFRIEVRDKSGRPVPAARIEFFLTGDSATTDSAGIATARVTADSAINITVRKIGFEPRSARFAIGTAPVFSLTVTLGDAGQKLPEVKITASYPGEPWRMAFEQRRKRNGGGGVFRDLATFSGVQPLQIGEWFAGIAGVQTNGGINGTLLVNRCRAMGVWIDGQHATGPGLTYQSALQTVGGQDVAAVELYTSSRPAQYTASYEDCSMLIWTRGR
jgi:hypothetical protein